VLRRSALLTVAWREIVERRACLVAACLLGIAPFVASLAWGLEGEDLRMAWKWSAISSAGALTAVLGPVFGAGLYAVAPSDPRLGFFLSRPIHPASLWAGKMAGATAVLLGCIALVIAPTWVAIGGEEGTVTFSVELEARMVAWWLQPFLDTISSYSGGVFTTEAWVVAVGSALIPVTHVITLMVRSRSPWLWLDIAAAVAIATGWSWVDDSTYDIARLSSSWRSVAALSIVAAAYAGSAAAVIGGRTSLQAARRLLTPVVWTTSCGGFAVLAAWVAWITTSDVGDVVQIYGAKPAPRGTWIALMGTARGAAATFLHDPATGRSIRVGVGHRRSSLPHFSGDGRTAVWSRNSSDGFELVIADLDAPGPRPMRTGVRFDHHLDHVAFSPTDGRFATVVGERLSVFDAESNQIVAGSRLPGANWYTSVVWEGEDALQVYRSVGTGRRTCQLSTLGFDVASDTLSPRSIVDDMPCRVSFRAMSHDGIRLLVIGRWDDMALLLDAQTGQRMATLVDGEDRHGLSAGFLGDGRIAVSHREEGGATIRLFSPDGEPERRATVEGDRILLGCETTPGRLAFAVAEPNTYPWENPTLMLLDVDTGEFQTVAGGLAPACYLSRNLWADWVTRPEPGSPATHLFYGCGKRSLVRFDPQTGEREVLVGREE